MTRAGCQVGMASAASCAQTGHRAGIQIARARTYAQIALANWERRYIAGDVGIQTVMDQSHSKRAQREQFAAHGIDNDPCHLSRSTRPGAALDADTFVGRSPGSYLAQLR